MAGTRESTASSSQLVSSPIEVQLLDRDETGSSRLSTATEPASAGWHESVYAGAAGDMSRVRWADGRPNPSLVCWLNAEAPGMVRPGARVVVVGCGLGDDVAELTARGYDALGFDISPTAVSWARRRFPDLAPSFVAADLLDPPGRFRPRFDLVVEVNTLQSLHPSAREEAAQSLASLASPRGIVLAICRARDESLLLEQVDGPPWPLAPLELSGLMEAAGLRPVRALDDFLDDESPPVRRLRGIYVHA